MVRFCGKAKIDNNRESIKKHWSSQCVYFSVSCSHYLPTFLSVAAYFGDLKDGVHKGDENDPRVSLIEVVPEEIRYWLPTKGSIGRAIETGLGAMTGKAAAPGELRTIAEAEVRTSKFKCLHAYSEHADQVDTKFVNEVIHGHDAILVPLTSFVYGYCMTT